MKFTFRTIKREADYDCNIHLVYDSTKAGGMFQINPIPVELSYPFRGGIYNAEKVDPSLPNTAVYYAPNLISRCPRLSLYSPRRCYTHLSVAVVL